MKKFIIQSAANFRRCALKSSRAFRNAKRARSLRRQRYWNAMALKWQARVCIRSAIVSNSLKDRAPEIDSRFIQRIP